MPITTGNIGLIPASSGSELTSSFDVLNVFFSSPTYGSVNPTASVASIKVNIIEFNNSGSAGELTFHTNSPENSGSVGDPVLTLFATGSNNEPRVGIGFSGSEKPIKAFEIKTKSNTVEGSEILIRSSRNTEGAVIGDLAGAIRFTIDSASYGDITTSGSVALIDAITTKVSEEGVQGDLSFGIASVRDTDAPTEILRLRENDGAPKVTITGSLEITDDIVTPTIETITIPSISGDGAASVDTFAFGSGNDYRGAIYDYNLYSTLSGSRTGQFMVSGHGTSLIYTDTSTKHLVDSVIPEISASISGGTITVWVINGNQYTFKAFVKKL
jgi:hypothetical protein